MVEEDTVVLLGQNLIFMPHIMNAAQGAGLNTRYANSSAEFWSVFKENRPELVLVDLEGDSNIWTDVLAQLHSSEPGIRIVAFGQHSDTAGLERARNLGCKTVLTKGEFRRDMQLVIGGRIS